MKVYCVLGKLRDEQLTLKAVCSSSEKAEQFIINYSELDFYAEIYEWEVDKGMIDETEWYVSALWTKNLTIES